MSAIPTFDVIAALNPVNAGSGDDVLVYENLRSLADKYASTDSARTAKAQEAGLGSLEEETAAQELGSEYLLLAAERLLDAHSGSRDVWADRFTASAIKLYGEPDADEARQLIADEYHQLLTQRDHSGLAGHLARFLADTYWPIVTMDGLPAPSSTEAANIHEQPAVKQLDAELRLRYQPIFDLVDEGGKEQFTPTDLHEVFSRAQSWLQANDDPSWGLWRVRFKAKKKYMSVSSGLRQINIATGREPATRAEARGLLAHELLVHARRANNGYKLGIKELATGLAGYIDTEEGLAILAETAINNILPDKVIDRYIDIALALGTVDGTQRSRQDLFKISYARRLLRALRRGASEDVIKALPVEVWTHVDRIYRGGPGDSHGVRQAVFPKDISYYVGFKQMLEYVNGQLANGRAMDELFNFLMQGKFDPTNAHHLAYLEK